MKVFQQIISLSLVIVLLCSIFPVMVVDTRAAEIAEISVVETVPVETTVMETVVEEAPIEATLSSETEVQETVPAETEEIMDETVSVETETATDETISKESDITDSGIIPEDTTEQEEEMIDQQEAVADLIIDETIPDNQVLADNSDSQSSAAYPGCMPSIGNPKVLVFYVTLPEGTPAWDLDIAGVENLFFSETGESLRTFYEKSSYEKLHIDGTVYEYTTKQDVSYYTSAEMIIDEIIEEYQNTINWDDYDVNQDGCIDGIYIVPKTEYIWDGPNFVSAYGQSIGNLTTNQYCLMRSQDLITLCHETCHMFGIPDIYAGSGLNPQGSNTDSIMDDDGSEHQGTGDLPGILKYALGWIDNPIFFSGTGTRDMTLQSVSTNGEIAIIYPNGDTGNNNWMVVEYLTKDANNHHSGVRIWKTKILRDEDNSIQFRYLEAISPFKQTNYYFNAGESVTPYTYPSTSYGVTYRSAGDYKTRTTCFDEIGFSGISISVKSTNDKFAELTVSIDNTIKDIPGTAVLTFSDSTSDVIVDSAKTLIATVESELEMMVAGEISLKDDDTGTIIPVDPVFNAYSNILYLYISEENMDSLVSGKTYLINLNDAVKTYYGSDISIKDFDGTITIRNLGIPIHAEGPYETSFFGLPERDFYAPDVFRIDNTHAMHFGYVDRALFMRTHDISTHQYTDVKATVNPPSGELQIDKVVQIDEEYYAVMFRNSLEERTIIYIAVYDLNGHLIDEYTSRDNAVYYVGGHAHPVVIKDGEAQELKVQNGQLIFKPINYPFSSTNATKASQYKLTDTMFAFVSRTYVPSNHVTVTLLTDSDGNTTVLEYDNVRDVDIIYKDNKLYVLTAGEDLILHVYDSSIDLIEERVLFNQISMKHLSDLKLGFVGNDVWCSFNGTSSINDVDYSNSYLLVFTPNMPTQYYRYGDKSSTYMGTFCYMGNGTFVMATKNPYYVLKAEVSDHDCTYTSSVVAPTCTEQGYTLHTCTECDKSYKDNYVDATGHNWDKGTITKEPTLEETGIMIYTCTICKETRTEKIGKLSAVQRIAGADRIETALAVAKELKTVLGVDKFDSIILAAGGSGSDQTKFADALSGSYLASAKKAPILLYTKGDLSSKNLTFIEENLSANGTIYLLGGNVSIPAEVEEALNASGYTTKRLGGADRYQTNLIILDEAGIDSADEILIAGGQAFADSLSASATGLPIMLVNGTKTTLTTAQVEFLQSLNGKKVTILGGTAAVSADLEAAIEEAFGGDADRIYGDARENTSAMIAEKYFADADMALIAYSRMYPDGLAGGVLANALHAPLLLTKAGSESIANAYIEEYGIEAGYALGGTAVMTDETVRAVFGLAEDAVISQK